MVLDRYRLLPLGCLVGAIPLNGLCAHPVLAYPDRNQKRKHVRLEQIPKTLSLNVFVLYKCYYGVSMEILHRAIQLDFIHYQLYTLRAFLSDNQILPSVLSPCLPDPVRSTHPRRLGLGRPMGEENSTRCLRLVKQRSTISSLCSMSSGFDLQRRHTAVGIPKGADGAVLGAPKSQKL